MAWDYAIAAQQQTDPVLQSAPAGIFTWYDQTKVAAAQAAQGAGADGRTVLNGQALASTLNPLTGLTYNAPASLGTGSYSYTDGGGEGGGQQATWNPDGKMSDATYGFQGSNLSVIPADQLAQFGIQAEPGATYISGNGFDTPGGNGEKDQGFGIYKVSADGTSATPVGATNQYVASDWVDGGRQMAKGAAAVAGAAFGAAALGGAAGAGGAAGGGTGAGGLSGMDLAADAALGTGNNIATAGGALGPGGGATAAGGATQFGGGYDFGSGTGATFGGQGGAGVDALGTGIPAGTTMPSLASASPATVSALQTAAQQAGKTLQEFATSPSGIKLLVAGAGAALAGGAASGGSGGGSGIGDQTGIAAQQAALGTSMVDWNKERYAAGQPTRDAATAGALTAQTGQLATQASQDAAATDTRNFAGTTLRPLESKMATDALGYDTAGRRADATAAAASDVEQSYAASNEANNRDMLRTGVTPGSGRMQSLMADQAIAKANARAAATTGAVRNVEATGAQRVSDAQKALQYLPGEATTEANSGVAAGTAAANSGTNAVASQGAGITNVNAGYTGAISANNSAGNLYNQAATLADKQYGQIGDAVGNYLSSDNGQKNLGDLANWISDKKLKKGTGKKADGEKALAQINATPVEDGWKYDPKKGGPDDGGKKHIGPMAQQVRRTMGEHVAPGGKEISPMDMNGKLMAGMQALTKRIGKLEARVA